MDHIGVNVNFDDITLLKIIGQGSYGVVHKGVWRTDAQESEIAVKIIINHSKDGALEKNISREIQNLKKCIHPNIISLYGVSKDTNYIYLIFEYADCGSLFNFLHNTKDDVSFKEKLSWMLQFAKGMEYLHSINIVHRDLKTQNLLLFNEYRKLKICDFGTVKELATLNTELVGTVSYMAPEVCISKGKYTEKCDVFSFGIILWEVMSRKKPFYELDDMNIFAIQQKVVNGSRPKINDVIFCDKLDYIGPIIENCWDNVPENRPTIKELCDLLPVYRIFPLKCKIVNFDDILLVEIIGSGSYKANWKPLHAEEKLVAFKVLHGRSEDSVTKKIKYSVEILREFQDIQKCVHPNIITLYGVCKDPKQNNLCLVAEYSECGSVYNFLHIMNFVPSFHKQIDWLRQCAKGLEYLHSKNIIHRNLTTQSLFLFNNYRTLKIRDFGTVKELTTMHTKLIRTLSYVAPEVCNPSEQYNEKCDIFNFGIIFWEVMSRKKSFHEYKGISLESKIIDGVRPNINEIKDSEQIDSIKRIIEECWSQNPANRPSIKELVNFLEETEFYVDINFENMELNNVVANGIYGCVWSGFWPNERRKVAAKYISCNQENRLDILREIHKLKALNHENIVSILGISRHSTGCVCAVIEYAECGSLYNLLHTTNRQIFLPDKLKWMLQCARGLEYLRRENVVHQDLKTQNLLLFNKYQTLKICDFGSVMEIVESNLRSIESLFYTAPEVYIVNNKFTEKSRVYSFGIILWEVMTRKKPFENFKGMEPMNIQMEIIKGARPNIKFLIHEDYTNLFNSIKEIIQRCWKESPIDRPTTMYLYEKFLTIINVKFA